MMEPRLQQLIKLWNESLEGELGADASAELEQLLQDPGLVEQFGEWQAQRSPAEALDAAETPGLDQRVLQAFRRRRAFAKALPWAIGAVVGLGALALGLTLMAPSKRVVAHVVSEDELFNVREQAPEAQPTQRPTLGLPPGYGQRPTKLEIKVGRKVDLRWTQPADGRAAVKVYDGEGEVVRTLWQGRAEAGRYTNTWNGKDDQGRLVRPGRYRLVAESNGDALAERKVQISADAR